MSNIIPEQTIEKQPNAVTIEGTRIILSQMENCICKLYPKTREKGTGFFCKIPFLNKLLPVLITNNHVLNEEDIKSDKIIRLTINDKLKKIEINNSRKKYTNSKIDLTIIEINPNKDEIYNYLEIEENDIYSNEEILELDYPSKSIYILHYPKGHLSVSYGLINDITDNKIINHYCTTDYGSSGSPLLSSETFKVIGIHCGSHVKYKYNCVIFIKYAIDLFFKSFKSNNNINIIYNKTNKGGKDLIFGKKFVKNNENNIKLIINGIKSNLIGEYNLKEGENNIEIIIKNKITNLENMFYDCKTLKNITELEKLDTKDINNFSYMFYGCSSLSDLKGLENWKVSNGKNFEFIFSGCSSLSDINELQSWDVSNVNNFESMFS